MRLTTDVLVIGSGTAGYTLALALRKAGLQVAVTDDKPYGGTCGMHGCEPEKFLVAAAQVVKLSHQMSEIGIHPPAQIDWPALMRSKSAFTDGVPDRTERALETAGAQLFRGTARFVTPEEVAVGDDTTIRARAVVVATGARTAPLDFPGAEITVTPQAFMDFPAIPRRVVFIGGGCLSLAMAHVARAAGAAVTVLQRGDRILKVLDGDLAARVAKSAQADGIQIGTGVEVSMVEPFGGALVAYGKKGCTEAFACDLVVNGSGRVADLSKLELGAGQVAYGTGGVKVNEYLQSVSNPLVWAIGDACDSPFHLSVVDDMEAEVAADNIVNGKRSIPDYASIPSVVSTLPAAAQVGMTEQQARASGIDFRLNRGTMEGWPSSRRIGQRYGFYKIMVEQGSGRIVGAHLFGHNAAETINIFALAMKHAIPAQELKKMLWAYPTEVSDLRDMIS
ncbi:hypothetical protein GMSM_02910 [Geomonas sp. Red276]